MLRALERNPWADDEADACRRQLRGDDDVAEAGERLPW